MLHLLDSLLKYATPKFHQRWSLHSNGVQLCMACDILVAWCVCMRFLEILALIYGRATPPPLLNALQWEYGVEWPKILYPLWGLSSCAHSCPKLCALYLILWRYKPNVENIPIMVDNPYYSWGGAFFLKVNPGLRSHDDLAMRIILASLVWNCSVNMCYFYYLYLPQVISSRHEERRHVSLIIFPIT